MKIWRKYKILALLKAYLHTMYRFHPTYFVHNRDAIWCPQCNHYFWWSEESILANKYPEHYMGYVEEGCPSVAPVKIRGISAWGSGRWIFFGLVRKKDERA